MRCFRFSKVVCLSLDLGCLAFFLGNSKPRFVIRRLEKGDLERLVRFCKFFTATFGSGQSMVGAWVKCARGAKLGSEYKNLLFFLVRIL